MLLEAIDRPFRFHFVDGLEIRLAPGAPVHLDETRARSLLQKVPGRVKVVRGVAPGDRITWERADGTRPTATVDFLHTDSKGTVWAFYSLPDGHWGAVNTAILTKRAPHG